MNPKSFYGKAKRKKHKVKIRNLPPLKSNSLNENSFSSHNTQGDIYKVEKKCISRYPLIIEFRGLFPGCMKDRELFLDVTNSVAPLKGDLKNIFVWGLQSKSPSARRSILTNIVRHSSAFTKIIVILPESHPGNLIYSIKGRTYIQLIIWQFLSSD